jgi:hypothetical protein
MIDEVDMTSALHSTAFQQHQKQELQNYRLT